MICAQGRSKMNVARTAMVRQAGRFFVYTLASVALIGGPRGYAQTSQKNEAGAPSETAIMQALLVEVRQLREAVQHVAAVDVHVQLVLQQMQLEQQQMNRASSRLDDIRKQIADFSSHE